MTKHHAYVTNTSDKEWDWGEAVTALAWDHEEYWRDKPDWFWFWKLLKEFRELASALLGIHKDSPEWELMQIAAICLNWLEKRETDRGDTTCAE